MAEAPATPFSARRLLLDTHVWLWWKAGDRRLGSQARAAIATAGDVWFSAASAWEIAIKTAAGKLTPPVASNLVREIARDGFQPLSITLAHAEELRSLPSLHRDPFDRMLVAQARVEGLTLVTADVRMVAYDVPVMRATE